MLRASWLILAVPTLTLMVAWAIAGKLTQTRHWLDHPNDRSLHQRPVPRTGGWAVLSGLVTGGAMLVALSPALRSRLPG